MMDMFTIILVFLLTFFDPSQAASDTMELPAVPASGADDPGLRVDVRKDGVWLAGARVVALDGGGALLDGEGAAALGDALQNQGTTDGLVVAVDRAVPYATVAAVLSAASAAGFDEYRFVVESTR